MDGVQVFCAVLVAAVVMVVGDHEFMVTNADSRAVSRDFETTMECKMNIVPDKFQWKFYPLSVEDAFNPKAAISLSKSKYVMVPTNKYTTQKRQSVLTIKADSEQISGDYQCLAYYGASVVASVPWRITIANLGTFPPQPDVTITIAEENTINWRCEPPESNPEACIDYYRNDNYIMPFTPSPSKGLPPFAPMPTKSLIIPNITTQHTGSYKCRAVNTIGLDQKDRLAISTTTFNLKVVKTAPSQAPIFIIPPKRVYTVIKGASVFLECSAVGNPVPKVIWVKKNGVLPENRTAMVDGGLIITNISSSDDGIYVCNHKNSRGSISHQITLIYNEPPSIECISFNSTEPHQGEDLDLDCSVSGTPEPQISWFLNGFSVHNDSAIEAIGNKIYFRPVEKRHAGNLQIFARNIVNTVYSSISVKVIPLTSSIDVSLPPVRNHPRHHKGSRKPQRHNKYVLPKKPTVRRLNDEAVMVQWELPLNNKGLPILFFKVQYKELGPANKHDGNSRRKGSQWMTTNNEYPPHIRSSEVNNLKAGFYYRFRIAAVYNNNDNKNSENSERFLLRKLDFDERNPLPIPLITRNETINSTAVRIFWKCDQVDNTTIEGFFINYISASTAADYLKATVDGADNTDYILSHLQPDTVYDIKLQSFTAKSASDFSSITKVKTLPEVQKVAVTTSTVPPLPESAPSSKLYFFIATGVIGVGAAIIAVIALLLFCRKWKQKKNNNRNDHDKPAVEEHHIQADGDYVVSAKTQPRSNGCIAQNRITITANPLADADNKNQNMIEMSCLSSQNNNCSVQQPSVSSGEETSPAAMATDSKDTKNKERTRTKHSADPSGENYV